MLTPSTPSVIRSQIVPIEPSSQPIFQATDYTLATFIKNTTGVVIIGTSSSIQPTTANGNGIALPDGIPVRLLLGPGTSIFAIANGAGENLAIHSQTLDVIELVLRLLGQLGGASAEVPGSVGEPATRVYPGQPEFKKYLAGQGRR